MPLLVGGLGTRAVPEPQWLNHKTGVAAVLGRQTTQAWAP